MFAKNVKMLVSTADASVYGIISVQIRNDFMIKVKKIVTLKSTQMITFKINIKLLEAKII